MSAVGERAFIAAHQLSVGDTIVAAGSIDLRVTGLRRYPGHGLIVAEYDSAVGAGARTMVASSFVAIIPGAEQEAH